MRARRRRQPAARDCVSISCANGFGGAGARGGVPGRDAAIEVHAESRGNPARSEIVSGVAGGWSACESSTLRGEKVVWVPHPLCISKGGGLDSRVTGNLGADSPQNPHPCKNRKGGAPAAAIRGDSCSTAILGCVPLLDAAKGTQPRMAV